MLRSQRVDDFLLLEDELIQRCMSNKRTDYSDAQQQIKVID